MVIDYEKELNKEQYEAVTATEGPLLILAGAGSGKTRTLVYRVAYLVEKGVNPEQILLLTFTNKAADEMKERAERMLDERCGRITACTYHSFCAKQLRKYACLVGIPNNYSILDSSDEAEVISMMKTEFKYNKVKNFPNSTKAASIISRAINTNCSVSQVISQSYPWLREFSGMIETLGAAARKYKKKNGMLGFDDILVYFNQVLEQFPAVRKKLSDTYRYIMVDEYQDSNYLQEQIVFRMREENRNLAVVGDDAQSLYGFRGSRVENILHFPDKMPGCRTVYLTRNYRSNQEIMDLSNHVMKAHSTEGYLKKMTATHYKQAKPRIVHVDDMQEEAQFIGSEIRKVHDSGVPYHEICVLARASYQTYHLEAVLNSMGIPYDKYGGIKFLEKAHVKDVLCILRTVVNERDEIAWYRILQLIPGIGRTYARNLAAECREKGADALRDNRYSKRAFQSGLTKMHEARQEWISLDDLHAVMDHVIRYYHQCRWETVKGMDTDEWNRKELFDENDRNFEELKTLLDMANGYTELVDFLDAVSLVPGTKDGEDDMAVISTIHSAKGLEFHTVFVLDCVDEVFPSTKAEDAGSREDNEELRCFYVAVTRAKENLYLMVPEIVSKFGRVFAADLSHYLTDSMKYLA